MQCSLVCSIRKILNRIAAHGAFRKLTKSELFTRNICFSIIKKFIYSNFIAPAQEDEETEDEDLNNEEGDIRDFKVFKNEEGDY